MRALAEFINGLGGGILDFSVEMGWVADPSSSLIAINKHEADEVRAKLNAEANATFFWKKYSMQLTDCKGNLRDMISSDGKLGQDNVVSGVATLSGAKIDSPTYWLRITSSPEAGLDHDGGSAFEGSLCDSPDLSVKALGQQVALIKLENVACPVTDSLSLKATLNIADVAIVRTALMIGHLDFEARVRDGDTEIACLNGHMKKTR